jgi:hypothetical protein
MRLLDLSILAVSPQMIISLPGHDNEDNGGWLYKDEWKFRSVVKKSKNSSLTEIIPKNF